MKLVDIGDDAVERGLLIRRTKRRRYVASLGDHTLIRISQRLGRDAGDQWRIFEGTPLRIGDGILINSFDDPETRHLALVRFRITAVPARKRVVYGLPDEQVLLRAPVVRSFAGRTHRWHEILAWLTPGQTVVADIESTFPGVVIQPLEITYDGETVNCDQRAASSGAARPGVQS